MEAINGISKKHYPRAIAILTAACIYAALKTSARWIKRSAISKSHFLMLIILLSSCSKQQTTSEITLQLVTNRTTSTVEKANACRSARPTTAKLTTDKGTFDFQLTTLKGGYESIPLQIPPGNYKINGLVLVDDQGTITHYVQQGPSNAHTSWTQGSIYDLSTDRDILFQVNCN